MDHFHIAVVAVADKAEHHVGQWVLGWPLLVDRQQRARLECSDAAPGGAVLVVALGEPINGKLTADPWLDFRSMRPEPDRSSGRLGNQLKHPSCQIEGFNQTAALYWVMYCQSIGVRRR
jgi:hypothetical protein